MILQLLHAYLMLLLPLLKQCLQFLITLSLLFFKGFYVLDVGVVPFLPYSGFRQELLPLLQPALVQLNPLLSFRL